ISRVPEITSSAPHWEYTVNSSGTVLLGLRTSIRSTAGVGRFALFAIVAMTRNTPPGATESGIPSTVRVTAKPVTCTSFDTVLLSVGVRMPTALAAIKTATKAAARGPSLIPVLIVHVGRSLRRRRYPFQWQRWSATHAGGDPRCEGIDRRGRRAPGALRGAPG